MQQAATAELQFAQAKVEKSRCIGLTGIAKSAQKRVAADAYAKVRLYWPDSHPYVEEACYRRAEILRSLGEDGAARGCFEEVITFAPVDSDFHIRALLELGHLCRRNKLYKDSLMYYAKSAAHKKGSLRYQIMGQAWIAKLNLSIKEYPAAITAALKWRQRSLSSVDYIRASDVYMCALAQSHNWQKAETVLSALHKKMKRQANAPGKEGAAIATALARLKADKVITLMRQGGR